MQSLFIYARAFTLLALENLKLVEFKQDKISQNQIRKMNGVRFIW